MDRLTQKMIEFNKLAGFVIKWALGSAAFGAFLMWSLTQFGIIRDWKKPSAIIGVFIISVLIIYKLKKVFTK